MITANAPYRMHFQIAGLVISAASMVAAAFVTEVSLLACITVTIFCFPPLISFSHGTWSLPWEFSTRLLEVR